MYENVNYKKQTILFSLITPIIFCFPAYLEFVYTFDNCILKLYENEAYTK